MALNRGLAWGGHDLQSTVFNFGLHGNAEIGKSVNSVRKYQISEDLIGKRACDEAGLDP